MMKPIVLSDLEAHLIAEHKVKAELISELQARVPERREDVARTSHALMHMTGMNDAEGHTHDEFRSWSLIDDMPENFEATMGIRQVPDEELAENKHHFIETFGEDRWNRMMDALNQPPTTQLGTRTIEEVGEDE